MDVKTLQPIHSIIKTEGNLSYGESVRGWNTIRLKKELINEFSTLKDRDARFRYKIIFYRSYPELEKAIRRMRRNKVAIPCLMFFEKVVKINREKLSL